MLLHLWLLETLDMCGIAENMCTLIKNSLPSWKMCLFCNKYKYLTEVTINRGILQGDSCSPLLFVIALIPSFVVLHKVNTEAWFSPQPPSIHGLFNIVYKNRAWNREAGWDCADMQQGNRDGIQYLKICGAHFEMRKKSRLLGHKIDKWRKNGLPWWSWSWTISQRNERQGHQ